MKRIVAIIFAAALGSSPAGAASQQAAKAFDTPQHAAEALVAACEKNDAEAMLQILGPSGKSIVASGDPVEDRNGREKFVALAREKMRVDVSKSNKAKATVVVGADDWPLPIPLVQASGKWHFDSKAGAHEILLRRIGRNELDAIKVCRGYVEAQHAYALQKHDGSSLNQYAQKIISTPGKHDGLAWRNPDGTPGGPVGDAIARAIAEGHTAKSEPYHGYYFKILKGQGPAAPLGQLDFVVKGAMIGGFALVAAPAEYRSTGVKTFMVSHDGVVWEKDLGPKSLDQFRAMERFNPDKTWHFTEDEK